MTKCFKMRMREVASAEAAGMLVGMHSLLDSCYVVDTDITVITGAVWQILPWIVQAAQCLACAHM